MGFWLRGGLDVVCGGVFGVWLFLSGMGWCGLCVACFFGCIWFFFMFVCFWLFVVLVLDDLCVFCVGVGFYVGLFYVLVCGFLWFFVGLYFVFFFFVVVVGFVVVVFLVWLFGLFIRGVFMFRFCFSLGIFIGVCCFGVGVVVFFVLMVLGGLM